MTIRHTPPTAPRLPAALRRCATLLAVCAATAAQAAGTVTWDDRLSESRFQATAGASTAGVMFTENWPGDPVVTGFAPATLGFSGSGSGTDSDVNFSVSFEATWAQTQTFAFSTPGADSVLTASGSLVSTMDSLACSNFGHGCNVATQRVFSTNWQAFRFTLDATTAYTLAGGSTGGQQLELLRHDGNGNWLFVATPGNTGFAAFDFSGSLDAGQYELRNFRFVMESPENYSNSWDYRLTLHDTVSAVPEPQVAAMLLAGLGLMGLQQRRQRRRLLQQGVLA